MKPKHVIDNSGVTTIGKYIRSQDDAVKQEVKSYIDKNDLVSLYHLGAFDTVDTSNADYDVIHKNGSILDTGTLAAYPWSVYGGSFYTLPGLLKQADYTTVTPPVKSNFGIVVNNNIYNSTSTGVLITTDNNGYLSIKPNDTNVTSVNDFLIWLNTNKLIIEYELADSYKYTFNTIKNQPINTLDQQGSEFIRDEWEKSQNLVDKDLWKTGWSIENDFSNLSYCSNMGYIAIKPNTKYTIAYYDGTFQSNQVLFYNSSKVRVGAVSDSNSSQRTVTSPSSAVFARIQVFMNGTAVSPTKVMLVEGDHIYPYQEYRGSIIHEKELEEVAYKNIDNYFTAEQTITSPYDTPLKINSTQAAGECDILFHINGNTKAWLGVNNDAELRMYTNSWGAYRKIAFLQDQYESITWASLKSLRDNSQLIPGKQYRITDYTCTTTTANTSSAGHVFDIIVVADDVNKLNELARACLHSGDTYFANSNLSVWKLWYCLDNDASRFAWADSTNGKGVIYRIIDEFGNDVPYDFKNILFTTSGNYTNAYTFTYTESNTIKDASLLGLSKDCYNNIIKEYINANKQQLNFNVLYSSNSDLKCFSNTFGNDCYNNMFLNSSQCNTFGAGCSNNIFKSVNLFNTFGNGCENNTFENDCQCNTFGNGCYSNTFGSRAQYNIFGNGCQYNTFGNYCRYNIFGNYCRYITFGNSSSVENYYRYNIVDSGCQYLYIVGNGTASSSNQLQNVHIHSGVLGTSSSYKTITVDRGLTYSTDVYTQGSTDMFV